MKSEQELVSALQAIPWFQVMDGNHFNKLVSIAKIFTFEPGQVIFREGDKEDYLYVVIEGRIAIDISVPGRGRMRILTADAMEVVGWSSVTPVVRQRTAGARAVLPSRLVAFDAIELRKLCDEDHDLGYFVMRRLANVVASRLMTTRLQLLDIFANPADYKEE
ncbi:MAG: Crp/Fnr family transcriptional regulator [Anaerolineales bacterium]